MARKKKLSKPAKVVERNTKLAGNIVHYLLNNQGSFSSLPDNFELVILPDDDPEMRLYNLKLLDKYGSDGKPIVFARTKARRRHASGKSGLSLFVPLQLTPE